MYCINCGNKIDNKNIFCTNCGINLKPIKKEEENGLKIVSIILGGLGILLNLTIIFSFVGFILSIIGLILGIVASKKEKNVIGIILNSVSLFIFIIFICILMFIFNLFFKTPEEFVSKIDSNNYYEKYDDVLNIY